MLRLDHRAICLKDYFLCELVGATSRMEEVRHGCKSCRSFGLRVFGVLTKGWAIHASVKDGRCIRDVKGKGCLSGGGVARLVWIPMMPAHQHGSFDSSNELPLLQPLSAQCFVV